MRKTLQGGAVLVALSGALLSTVSFAQGADPNAGRDLAAACANCHGTNGASGSEMPNLAGKSAFVTIALMREFREGKRTATIMHQISKGYTDEQIALIAAYLAAQKPK
jgi:cytochrome subunit of sulfide dehydrogenase